MNRTLIYLLLFVVAAGAAFVLVIKEPWTTLQVHETAFALEDTAGIGKIFIADMDGKKLVLARTETGWTVNEKYEVRRDYINKLLATIRNVSVSQPVPESAVNTVIKNMSARNKKVEIYDREGELLKAYYVGGPSLNDLGTYMLIEGSEHPYVTAIPGFQGTLESRYATDEFAVRSGTIYNYRIHEIKSVAVTYFTQPDSSFRISVLAADSIQLSNGAGQPVAEPSRKKLQEYLEHFRFVNCESFINDLEKKDSVLKTVPYCSIEVRDRNDQPDVVVIYHMPRLPDSVMQYDFEGNPIPYDTDHYFATIHNGRDFVIIQHFHFQRILKSIGWFSKPNSAKS